jgi:hypothetical protein
VNSKKRFPQKRKNQQYPELPGDKRKRKRRKPNKITQKNQKRKITRYLLLCQQIGKRKNKSFLNLTMSIILSLYTKAQQLIRDF